MAYYTYIDSVNNVSKYTYPYIYIQNICTYTCIYIYIRLMDKILHDPKDPKLYGNYGIFLIMGNAGFCPSAVLHIYMGSI